jgi:uncharacterized membrane protein
MVASVGSRSEAGAGTRGDRAGRRRWALAWRIAACAGLAGVTPTAVADAPSRFACRGNEPFWNLQIDGAHARYSRLGTAADQDLTGVLTPLDYLRPRQLVWRGRADGGNLVALLTAERCRDSMSDREGRTEFDHSVRISLPGGEVLVGCCQDVDAAAVAPPGAVEDAPVADLAAKPADDWTRFLLDLLPAIEACLDATGGPAPRVTKAWPMNHGMVGVRTRHGQGSWFDCIAPMIGGAVERIEPVPPGTARLPGEGVVLFARAADGPLAGECYEHERVLDHDGRLIGWLAYDVC